MKPMNNNYSTEQSCSCSSCLYKSESDRPSLRRFVEYGSKIDKLYYGKYIPLRERKLLGRLVTTRAVYDDVRKQILSGSSGSLNKAILKPKMKKIKRDKELDEVKKYSDILALVNLVDKGATLSTEKLSKCCSCCVCESNLITNETLKRGIHTRKHTYNRGYSKAKSRITKVIVNSKDRLGELSEFSRNVRFRTKRIRSEPCTCTYKINKTEDHDSDALNQTFHNEKPEPELESIKLPQQYKFNGCECDVEKAVRKSLKKPKRTQLNLSKKIKESTHSSMEKLKKSTTKLNGIIKSTAKRPAERFGHSKYKNIREKVKESLVSIDAEYIGRNAFPIKKDSLAIFREKLGRKRKQDNELDRDFECYHDTCIPEERFKKKKQIKMRSADKQPEHDSNKIEKKVGESPNVSEMNTQVHEIEDAIEAVKKKQKFKNPKPDKKLGPASVAVNFSTKKKVKTNKKGTKSVSRRIKSATDLSKRKSKLLGHPIFVTCECKPNISDQCIPERCETNFKKQHLKHRYKSTNTDFQTNSNQSRRSKSVSSMTSENIPDYSARKLKSIMLSKAPAVVNVTDNYKPIKQVVRIGSTFSFNIEFSKELSSGAHKPVKNVYERPKPEHNVKKARRHIHHRHSQMSNSTGTSQRTSTKYKLRKCFCALKITNPEEKKRINSMSKYTATSNYSWGRDLKLYSDSKTGSDNVGKKEANLKKIKNKPYACEPGIYALGKCDSYKCRKLMYPRQPKHLKSHVRKSNTESQKTRSTSSLTSSPVKQTKKVQSALVTHGRKDPYDYQSKKIVSSPQVIKNLESNNSSNRQAVKVGSSFSFNIEFYKENANVAPLISSPFEHQYVNKLDNPKNQGRELKVSPNHIRTEKKRKSMQIGSLIEHSLQKLKLYSKVKDFSKKEISNTGTKTPHFHVNVQDVTISQNTMTTKHYVRHLEPFECEPYICIPGECDPYVCLERIKKRDLNRYSREIGVMTKPKNLRSSYSSMQNIVLPMKDVFVQSNIAVQQMSSKQIKQTKSKNTTEKHINGNSKKLRQAVHIGSKFSFDIEFYKELPREELKIIQTILKEKSDRDSNKRKYRNTGDQPLPISVNHHKSQAAIQKNHKNTGVNFLKKCFCTLKLLKKQEKNKFHSLVQPTITPLNVYRVTTGSNKYTPQLTLAELMKNETSRSEETILNKHVETKISKLNNVFNYKMLKKTKISTPTIPEYLPKNIVSLKNSTILGTYNGNAFFKQNLYAMNLQLCERDNRTMYKLQPSECEPGVCTPYNCDPLKCQALINKRLLKSNSTSSGTKIFSKSASSLTSEIKPLVRNRKLQSFKAKERNKMQLDQSLQNKTELSNRKQTVRVGSNFNFNIEFSKSKSDYQRLQNAPSPSHKLDKKYKSIGHQSQQQTLQQQSRKTETLISTCDRKLQAYTKMNHKAFNATSHSKRCFCTLELRKHGQQKSRISTETQGPVLKNETAKLKTVDSTQNTISPKLGKTGYIMKSYECEPGVCVQGQCDPYDCLELIKKSKRSTKNYGTEPMKSKKVSTSSITNRHKTKMYDKRMQMKNHESACYFDPSNKQRTHKQREHLLSHTSDFKKKRPEKQDLETTQNRQAVRIGSNFSFEVEFYKNKIIENATRKDSPLVMNNNYIKKDHETITNDKINITRNKGTNGRKSFVCNQETQGRVEKRKNVSTGVSHVLKRCFCTLALQKQNLRKISSRLPTQNYENPILKQKSELQNKTVMTAGRPIPNKLKQYNCEPNICVPGKCDSQECKKYIIRRLHKKSQGTKRMRDLDSQMLVKNVRATMSRVTPFLKKCLCTLKLGKRESKSPPVMRNTIAVGSDLKEKYDLPPKIVTCNKSTCTAFKRNSTFIKLAPYECEPGVCVPGKCNPYECEKGIKIRENKVLSKFFSAQKPKDFHKYSTAITGSADSNNNKCVETICKPKKKNMTAGNQGINFHHRQSQVNRTRIESKGSSIRPLLKKCFCTFKLQKLGKYQHRPGLVTSQISQNGHRKNNLERPSKKHQLAVSSSSNEAKNRQAVCIGSSFSFNVEFYKNDLPIPTKSLPLPQCVKNSKKSKCVDAKTKSATSKACESQCKYSSSRRGSQVSRLSTRSTGSGVPNNLKKCFCTLALTKLHDIPGPPSNELNSFSKQNNINKLDLLENSTQTKINHTKFKRLSYSLEPYECEPGICVPGECDPNECIKMMKRIRRYSRTSSTQYNEPTLISRSSLTPTSDFKTKSMQADKKYKKKREHKPSYKESKLVERSRSFIPDMKNKQAVKIGSKFGFDIEFFKGSSPKKELVDPKYSRMSRPKVTTINRVEDHTIAQCFSSKQYDVYYQLQKSVKENCPERCKCSICDKDLTKLTATIGTRTKNKYLKPELNQYVQLKDSFGKKYTKKNGLSAMETILPYKPSKFNKKPSKTILMNDFAAKKENLSKYSPNPTSKNELQKFYNIRSVSSKNSDDKESKKKTFAKVSTSTLLKYAACRCTKLFLKQKCQICKTKSSQNNNQPKCMLVKSKRVKKSFKENNLKISGSERRELDKSRNKIKISKSLKIPTKFSREIQIQHKNRKYSRFQEGDTNNNNNITPVIRFSKIGDVNEYKKFVCLHCQKTYGNKNLMLQKPNNQPQNGKIYKTKIQKKKNVKFSGISSKEEDKVQKITFFTVFMNKLFCKCKTPENIHNKYEMKNKKANDKKKVNSQARKNHRKSSEFSEYCPYCDVRTINDRKDMGDAIDVKGKQDNRLKGKPKSGAKVTVRAKKRTGKNNVCECRTIIDKAKEDELLAKEMEGKICNCYPSACDCAKEVKRRKKRKEIFKKQIKKAKIDKKRRIQKEKQKRAAENKRQRDFFIRQKRYKIEDAIRLHKRRDLDAYLAHKLKTKGAPDCLVASESLLDLTKLSCTVLGDIGRSTYRALVDPHHTCKRVTTTLREPSRICPIIKTAIVNCGVPATFKRIVLRCKSMKTVKKIKKKLEQNKCTNYLVHICDRDPRVRLKNKKAQQRLKRKRVPLDVPCNLYTSSLRKKPCLKLFSKCTWFYPHFINLLGVCRKFTDSILFILAAVFWSPCILGTELCRAMMCCLLCTG